jgi:hypothetical protein
MKASDSLQPTKRKKKEKKKKKEKRKEKENHLCIVFTLKLHVALLCIPIDMVKDE